MLIFLTIISCLFTFGQPAGPGSHGQGHGHANSHHAQTSYHPQPSYHSQPSYHPQPSYHHQPSYHEDDSSNTGIFGLLGGAGVLGLLGVVGVAIATSIAATSAVAAAVGPVTGGTAGGAFLGLGRRRRDTSREDTMQQAMTYLEAAMTLDHDKCLPRVFCDVASETGRPTSKFQKDLQLISEALSSSMPVGTIPNNLSEEILLAAVRGRQYGDPFYCYQLYHTCEDAKAVRLTMEKFYPKLLG